MCHPAVEGVDMIQSNVTLLSGDPKHNPYPQNSAEHKPKQLSTLVLFLLHLQNRTRSQ